jgi:hypothetical protein
MWEQVIDGLEGRWWLLGLVAVVGAAKGARPAAKGAIKGYLAARDGITRWTAGAREGLNELYQEAVSQYRGIEPPADEQGVTPDQAAEAPQPAATARRPRSPRTAEPVSP